MFDDYHIDQIDAMLSTDHPRVAAAHLSMSRASTHTLDRLTLLWFTGELECEPGSEHHARITWSPHNPPFVWDRTGLGNWSVADHVQCGQCGAVTWPRAAIVNGHLTGEDLGQVARELGGGYLERWTERPSYLYTYLD